MSADMGTLPPLLFVKLQPKCEPGPSQKGTPQESRAFGGCGPANTLISDAWPVELRKSSSVVLSCPVSCSHLCRDRPSTLNRMGGLHGEAAFPDPQ